MEEEDEETMMYMESKKVYNEGYKVLKNRKIMKKDRICKWRR